MVQHCVKTQLSLWKLYTN